MIFSRLKSRLGAHIREHYARKPGQPMIVITTQKSGTVFVQEAAEKYLRMYNRPFHAGAIYDEAVNFRFLVNHVVGKRVYLKSHLTASKYNIRALEASGISRIVVHFRDPRDTLVSWYHHMLREDIQSHKASVELHKISGLISDDFYELDRDARFEWLVHNYYPKVVAWQNAWYNYYLSENRKLEVLLTNFEELRQGQERFIQKIFDFFGYGGEARLGNLEIPDEGSFKSNFRKGKSGTFLEELTSDQIKLVSENLPKCAKEFDWT